MKNCQLQDRISDALHNLEKVAGPAGRIHVLVEVEDEERWRELLASHQEAVRKELERFRGREVKTLGDGSLATFDGPARAIQSGLAIAEGARDLDLEVRIGLHAGEVELVDGDVGGIAVHIAARIGALAGPGEVLVSSTVKDLVAGSGIEFADRGVQELKGVPDEWRLYAAGA